MRYLHPDKHDALNAVLVKEARRRVAPPKKPRRAGTPGAAQASNMIQRIAERLDAAKRGL